MDDSRIFQAKDSKEFLNAGFYELVTFCKTTCVQQLVAEKARKASLYSWPSNLETVQSVSTALL